jgi:hypothetical protein
VRCLLSPLYAGVLSDAIASEEGGVGAASIRHGAAGAGGVVSRRYTNLSES